MRPPLSKDERGPGGFTPDFPNEIFLAQAGKPEPLMLGLLLEELDFSAQPFDFSIDVLRGPLGHRPSLPARRDLNANASRCHKRNVPGATDLVRSRRSPSLKRAGLVS